MLIVFLVGLKTGRRSCECSMSCQSIATWRRYCDLLRDARATWPETGFVVLLCTREREEYLQAMRLGAQEVLRCPLRPTDVDLVLIQAMKESDRKEMAANA